MTTPSPSHLPVDPARSPAGGNGFGRAALAALVWAALNLVLTFAVFGGPSSAETAGRTIGALLVAVLIGALAAWLITRKRARWAFWKLALLALPFFLVMRVISTLGG